LVIYAGLFADLIAVLLASVDFAAKRGVFTSIAPRADTAI
jgi:hypothetical protein